MNRKGRLEVPAEFDCAGEFKDGLAPVRRGKWVGYIRKDGVYKIAPRYVWGSEFIGGVAEAQLPSGELQYLDRAGNVLRRFNPPPRESLLLDLSRGNGG